MGGESPVVELYDSGGNPLSVQDGTAIPASTPGLLLMGSDGTNSRYITIDSSGRQIIVGAGTAGTATGGVVTIQGIAGGTVVPTSVSGTVTISGTVTANIGTTGGLALDSTLAKLTITQSSALGANTLAMVGGSVTTAAPTYTTGNINPLSLLTTGALRIDNTSWLGSTAPTVGSKTSANSVPVVLASDQGPIGLVDNAAFTDGTTRVLPVGYILDEVAGTALTENDIGASRMDSKRAQVVVLEDATTRGQRLTITAANAMKVDGSAVTQPVSGTVAATQSGTWTVQPGNTANTTPWLVTANIGTTGGLALDATLTGGTQTTRITDGTNTATVTVSNALKIDGSAVTQPVSGTVTANAGTGNFAVVQATAGNLNATVVGTVTANIGTTNGLALDATLTGGTQTTRITDGTNTATVKAASTAAVATDKALVVAISPNNTVGVTGTVTANIGTTNGLALDATLAKLTIAQGTALGSNTQALIGGSVTTASPTYTTGQISPLSLTTAGALRIDGSGTTQPVSGTVTATQSGTWTVQPGNTANTTPWLTTISQGGNSASVSASNALKVDGSAVTQPVSGTVTANIGTTNGLALDATLSAQSMVDNAGFTDGTSRIVPAGYILDEVAGTALTENDGAAARIDSKRAQVMVIEDTTTRGQRVTVTASNAMKVDGSAVTQPISGTVTANAGTGNFTVVGTATDNTSNSTAKLPVMAALANTSAPTWTNGNMVPLSVDTSGSLRITGSISATNPSVSTTGTAPPASATYIGGSVTTAAPTYTTGQMNALSLTTGGLLRVDGSGVTQPVSGTVTANIGTTNGLALDTSVNGILVSQGSTTSGEKGPLVQGAVTTAAPSYTTAQTSPLSLTTAGALRIDGSATTQPVSGTVTANQGGTWNITNISGTISLPTGAATETTLAAMSAKLPAALVGGRLDTNNGAWLGSTAPTVGSKTSANSIPVVVASDQGTITVNASATVGLVDNAAFTDGTTRVQPVAYILDEVAGTALTENDAAAARIDSKRAQVHVIEDATTRGTRATVKAASTAAVATDPAFVVAISPNNTVAIGAVTVSQSDTTATGSLNALNANVQVALAGTAGAAMQLVVGTLVGTIVPEISVDGGTTWSAGQFFDPITGVLASSIVFGSNNTAQTKTIIITGGTSHVRVRVSAYTSGTATCNLRATTANDPSTAIRGTDGTILRTVLLDTSGRIVIAPAGTSATTSGFTNGDILLTNTGNVPVRRTTLTEQSSNAQRSIVSSSANDTSAGTGARTVKITYYDSTGAGPSTETITMNGTSAVNTVSTTICYVEKIEVITVGSTGSNVGTITLKAATAGAGATIMTMSPTDNQTYLSVHYVPTGKTCYITGINVGSTSSGIAQGGLYTVRAQNLSGSNNPDKQISDFLYLFGQSSGLTRTYDTPIQVVGPARLQLWVNPFSNNTVTFGGGFDFYEQ